MISDGSRLCDGTICSDKLDSLIDEALRSRFSPSLVCIVGNEDRVLYRRASGFSRAFSDDKPCFDIVPGDYNGITPVSFATMYDMASLSKIIGTTMVALRFMELGKITLADTLPMFFENVPTDKRYINIAHLMTHTSGIPAHFRLDLMQEANPSDAVQCVLHHPLSHDVGCAVEYSCMGFILLGKILEYVGCEPLDALVQRLVLNPLGMSRTCYNPKLHGETDFAATEYSGKFGRYLCGEVHDENARFLGGVSGNAGIFSCADDLTRFASMLSMHGETPNGRFISERTFDAAIFDRTSQINHNEVRGLGFQLRGIDEEISSMGDLYSVGSYGHNGFTGPSLYVDLESGLYTIILANRVHFTRESTKLFRFRRIFHNAVLSEFE